MQNLCQAGRVHCLTPEGGRDESPWNMSKRGNHGKIKLDD